MKKDVTVQRVSGVVNLSDFPSEAFAASGWYVNDTTEYQAAEYAEETAVHTAGILRELGIAVHGDHARTGVRADWMEQDGPDTIYNWKNGHIQMRNHAETGTVTGVSIGISRCRGESFYAWFRIFFYPEKIVYENWFPTEN